MAEKTGRNQGGQFVKGHSVGRPKGSRNKRTLEAEALLTRNAKKLTAKAVEMALEGDATAMRLCLGVLLPKRDRPVDLTLPDLTDASDNEAVLQGLAAVVRGVADGSVTPAEAQKLGQLFEARSRIVDVAEMNERLIAIEKHLKAAAA